MRGRSSRRDPRLDLYKRTLLAWNEKINLIGPEAREHIDEHIEEALVAAEMLEPIVSPEARFHLVEADQKKWAFLKHVVRECGLNALVYGDRLRAALKRFPSDLRFSLVTSRAVGSPEEWVPSLPEHLADGARVALFQSSPAAPQIDGFDDSGARKLPRGSSNYVVTLTFHVEQ
jgi:16S rRNA G527 N7-methylase RsmG